MRSPDYRAEMRACAEAIDLRPPRIVQPQDRWVDLIGIRFHYLDWGNPTLPHLVLLHGAGLTAHTWDMASLLLRDRYHVIALDQRGHGDSGWTPESQLAATGDLMLRDTRDFIEAIGLERLILCGHSMGGANAIRYSARHPQRLDALVIVDMGPIVLRDARMQRFQRETETARPFDDFVASAVKFNPLRPPEHLRYSLLHSLKPVEGGWVWKQDRRQRANAERPTEEQWRDGGEERARAMRADLAAIHVPTLLLRGELSAIFTQSAAADVIACLPDGELAVIPRAGHTVQGDNPRDFVHALDAFLARRLARGD